MLKMIVDDSAVLAHLDGIDPRLREELKGGIGRLALKLQRAVKGKLNGEVLRVRTGRLMHSVGETVVTEGDRITGIVSTPVKYAPAHEFGFKGTVTVRAHLRTVKQAFGRPISPVQATVREHTAKMNLPERSFLRSALREMEQSGAIGDEISAAIQRALGKAG